MFEQANTIIFHIILFIGLYFQIFLLATFIEGGSGASETKEKKSTNPMSAWPDVSITVPCFNEANTLTGTINSLLNLNYPKDKLQIVIVDDGSTDSTLAVAKKLQLQHSQIKVFHQKNGGKWRALNFGLTLSKSALVGCLDADSYVDPQALIRMVPYFKNKEVMAVTPAICVYNPRNVLQLIQKAEYNIGIFLKQILGKLDAIHVTPGPFSIFRRQVFETIGNYRHAHNTEDMEIAFRMQMHRLKITNCPNAFIYTVTPNTVKKLYRQRVRWIYGFLKNSIDYRFLFLNKKYGNMGVFTLPFSMLFIITSLYVVANAIVNFAKIIGTRITKFSTVGVDLHFSHLNFDWFFINVESLTLLSLILMGIVIFIMLQGKKISEGNMRPGIDVLYFIFLYGFISPFWLSKAVYNTLLSKKTPWR